MFSNRTNSPVAVRAVLVAVIGALLTLLAVSTLDAPSASAAVPARTATTTTTTNATARRLPPGRRIVRFADRFVGTRYTWDGSSPRTGFDCSGFTKYVYGHTHVAYLPHQSNAQRFARRMHLERRRHARPGDLIFYMSGGRAYHVAIFLGHGRQISAVDPQMGVRKQRITAHNIQFRSDWHR